VDKHTQLDKPKILLRKSRLKTYQTHIMKVCRDFINLACCLGTCLSVRRCCHAFLIVANRARWALHTLVGALRRPPRVRTETRCGICVLAIVAKRTNGTLHGASVRVFASFTLEWSHVLLMATVASWTLSANTISLHRVETIFTSGQSRFCASDALHTSRAQGALDITGV